MGSVAPGSGRYRQRRAHHVHARSPGRTRHHQRRDQQLLQRSQQHGRQRRQGRYRGQCLDDDPAPALPAVHRRSGLLHRPRRQHQREQYQQCHLQGQLAQLLSAQVPRRPQGAHRLHLPAVDHAHAGPRRHRDLRYPEPELYRRSRHRNRLQRQPSRRRRIHLFGDDPRLQRRDLDRFVHSDPADQPDHRRARHLLRKHRGADRDAAGGDGVQRRPVLQWRR